MNCPADYVDRPKLLKCQTCILPTHPVCVSELAVGRCDRNQLGDEINELLELLFRPLTLNYCVLHGILSPLAILYIHTRAIPLDDLSIFIMQRDFMVTHPAVFTVSAPN